MYYVPEKYQMHLKLVILYNIIMYIIYIFFSSTDYYTKRGRRFLSLKCIRDNNNIQYTRVYYI